MSHKEELILGLGYCLFMLVLFAVFQRFPPKKINHFYGYRTGRSMKNQETWKAANEFSLNLSVKLCLYSLIFPVLLYFVYPQYNFLITVIVNTLLIISVYWFTEAFLKERFDEDGNPK